MKIPHEVFMCKPSDNIFGLEFTAFKLRDLDKEITLFEVEKPDDLPPSPNTNDDDGDSARFVRYEFSQDFLLLNTVGAT